MPLSQLPDFKHIKVAVVGDIIVDHYRVLKEQRLSPEAPVLVFTQEGEEYRAGGAANVAKNLEALGCQVSLFGVTGSDVDEFKECLVPDSHFVRARNRVTTVKERLVTKRQQVLRVDHQQTAPIQKKDADALVRLFAREIRKSRPDVLVFSDYAHGAVTADLVNGVAEAYGLGVVVVNSKAKDTLPKYLPIGRLCGCLFPVLNMHECRDMVPFSQEMPDAEVAAEVGRTIECRTLALTMGASGIMLCHRDAHSGAVIEVFPVFGSKDEDVVDVTGAGDTVTAVCAASINQVSFRSMMELANLAAGIVVRKRGVAVATPDELAKAMQANGVTLKSDE